MSELSDSLIETVDSILADFAPPDRTVSKRTITRTGSYQLIARSVAVSYADVVLDPQPVYRRVTRNDAILSQNTLVLADDYSFVLSVNAITKDELVNKNVVLVLEDASGNEEIVRLIAFIEPAVNLETVAFIAIFRSINRP
mgnify:CR=1 FL=1